MKILTMLLFALCVAGLSVGEELPEHLTHGLRVYFDFEEGDPGSVVDRSGHGHKVESASADVTMVEGAQGRGMRFQGGEGLQVANSEDLRFQDERGNLQDFTVAFWVNSDHGLDGQTESETYVAKLDPEAWTGWAVMTSHPDPRALMLRVLSAKQKKGHDKVWDKTEELTYPAGEWVHLAVVNSRGQIGFYQNGVLVAKVSGTMKYGSEAPLRIGRGVNGVLDGVGIWNRDLTEGEVGELIRATGGAMAPAVPAATTVKVPGVEAYDFFQNRSEPHRWFEAIKPPEGMRLIEVQVEVEEVKRKPTLARSSLQMYGSDGKLLGALGNRESDGERQRIGGAQLDEPLIFVVPEEMTQVHVRARGGAAAITLPEAWSPRPMVDHVAGAELQVVRATRIASLNVNGQPWQTAYRSPQADLVEIETSFQAVSEKSRDQFKAYRLLATADGKPAQLLERGYEEPTQLVVVPKGAQTLQLFYQGRKMLDVKIGTQPGAVIGRPPAGTWSVDHPATQGLTVSATQVERHSALETPKTLSSQKVPVLLVKFRPEGEVAGATLHFANGGNPDLDRIQLRDLRFRVAGVPIMPLGGSGAILFEDGAAEEEIFFPCGSASGRVDVLYKGHPIGQFQLP